MQEERALRTIAVVGSGIVGLSAAIAFARALPKVRVTVLATPPDPAALADRLSGTLTSVHGFHVATGIEESELVRLGAATHRIGTRFEHWSADGAPWQHAYGDYGRDSAGIGFHNLWVQARRAGRAGPFDRYSAAALLAEAGKFVHPGEDPQSPLSTYSYALRLDPERYRELLLQIGGRARLSRVEGGVAGVERREDGGVAAILLGDGRRLEADLFVDCGGPSAPVLSRIDDRFEDWSAWHPADRVLIGTGRGAGPSSCDRAVAEDIGWRGEAPLGERSVVTFTYSSAAAAEEAARRALAGHIVGEVRAVAIRPGRRPEPWVRNVLAIGEAAEAVDPLQATNLHLAQSAIMRALGLLAGRDFHPLELAEYNRRSGQQVLRVRDFIALHYLRSGRREGAFWKPLGRRAPPDSLAHTLAQFERRGRLPFYENESFDKHGWVAALLGLGVIPEHCDPIAAGIEVDESAAGLERLAAQLAAIPPQLPPYRDYLERMREAAPAGAARG